MKCQICNKNEANIVFTQIINNDKIVLQICSDCARKKGVSIEFKKPSQPKNMVSLLGSLNVQSEEKGSNADVPDLVCDGCGLTFAEFRKEGLFGCDRCHRSFGKYIPNLLKQIHGTDMYDGKLPETLSDDSKKIRELHQLRKELTHCIECEEYERAAEIRDKIAELEAKNVNSK